MDAACVHDQRRRDRPGWATLATDVQTLVTSKMSTRLSSFSNFTVTVSGVDQGTSYTGNGCNSLVAGDFITVTVSGKYLFMNIIPFHIMPTFTMTSACTMVCEGAS